MAGSAAPGCTRTANGLPATSAPQNVTCAAHRRGMRPARSTRRFCGARRRGRSEGRAAVERRSSAAARPATPIDRARTVTAHAARAFVGM
jgi:hypothetical protein